VKFSEAYLKELGLWPVWRLRPGELMQPSSRGSESPPPNHAEGAPGGEPQGMRPTEHYSDMQDRRTRILRMHWTELKQSAAACTACPLHASRQQAVFGVGDQAADWLFVGEGPGAEEDARGEPFVGQAGKLLDNMLKAIGLQRGRNVYIANIVKCRPPQNRNPEPDEIASCEPFLVRQLALIAPKAIVALGTFAAQTLLKTRTPITRLRGIWADYHGIPLMPTFHPAYLLRNPGEKRLVWEDIQQVMRALGLPR
jgi:uracil-DNA glycosylase